MPPLVKICGLKTPETVDAAIRHGATHIGLVHYEPSSRHVDLKTAAELRKRAGPHVKVALLLVNASQRLTGDALGMVRPDIIQFHGSETPEWLAVVKRLLATSGPRSKKAALLAAVAEESGEPSLTRAELAARSGVPEPLLASLEAAGLLVPARVGGEARYGEADLRMARAGLAVLGAGFPLPELMQIAMRHARHVESLADDTVTSMRPPMRENGGKRAVIMTTATLRALICLGVMIVPKRRPSRFDTICWVCTLCRLSPVPARPTTSPYPTSGLLATPRMVAMSFTRSARTSDGTNTTTARSDNKKSLETWRMESSLLEEGSAGCRPR